MLWLFGNWDVPQFAVCPVSFDDWLFCAGDIDVGGFGDGDLFVCEDSNAVIIAHLTNGKEWCLHGWNSVAFRGCWRQFWDGRLPSLAPVMVQLLAVDTDIPLVVGC